MRILRVDKKTFPHCKLNTLAPDTSVFGALLGQFDVAQSRSSASAAKKTSKLALSFVPFSYQQKLCARYMNP